MFVLIDVVVEERVNLIQLNLFNSAVNCANLYLKCLWDMEFFKFESLCRKFRFV